MPIQDYNIYTAKGYAGDLYDSAPRTTQSGRVEGLTLDYGVGVQLGAATGELPSNVLVGTTGNVWGISMRELNHEAANRPSDGTATYVQSETASIMREGFILVEVTGAAAFVAGAKLNIDGVTGLFTMDGVAGDIVATSNVTAVEAAISGDIAKVLIDIVHA